MTKSNKIVIITGQTATGKTNLALQYAQKFNGELINCDSRQIYKRLNIITGKDVVIGSIFQQDRKINHYSIGFYKLKSYKLHVTSYRKIWLYDIVSPNQYFSSFDYQQCAIFVTKKILSQGKTPIIVGGTYFYIKHLLYDIETQHIPPDWKLRKDLENKTVSQLQNMLKKINVQSFNRLNNSEKNNPQRLIRKIEILQFNRSGQHIQHPRLDIAYEQSKTQKKIILPEKIGVKNLELHIFGLKFEDKDALRKAIKNRVEERLKNGAIDEVKNLLKLGYKKTDPGLKTIGYQQLIKYLNNELTINEATNEWVTKEIQYAKRQYTFMKKGMSIKWKDIQFSPLD